MKRPVQVGTGLKQLPQPFAQSITRRSEQAGCVITLGDAFAVLWLITSWNFVGSGPAGRWLGALEDAASVKADLVVPHTIRSIAHEAAGLGILAPW